MQIVHPSMLTNFYVVGINYKKSDGETRGKFAINNYQYTEILNIAPNYRVESLFILSTCNRTEIYGFANDADCLIDLLCNQTTGDKKMFKKIAYVKNGENAIEHLFKVGAGLDSQILGDYEIIGQLKKAVKFSSDHGFVNCFMQRLLDNVLQASKAIKNSTYLSNGSTSVSFTALQYIRQHTLSDQKYKVLVIGAGKIGRKTCKNLVEYFDQTNITLINRSTEKAKELATELGLCYAHLNELPEYLNTSDIILVATSALEPVVLANAIHSKNNKLILDLSIPYNVEPTVASLTNVTLVTVDELSRTTDETLQRRKGELPKAMNIINERMDIFMDWYQKHQLSPLLKAVKIRLSDICEKQWAAAGNTDKITTNKLKENVQAVVKNMACKMQHDKNYGCYSLEAINELMQAVAN